MFYFVTKKPYISASYTCTKIHAQYCYRVFLFKIQTVLLDGADHMTDRGSNRALFVGVPIGLVFLLALVSVVVACRHRGCTERRSVSSDHRPLVKNEHTF